MRDEEKKINDFVRDVLVFPGFYIKVKVCSGQNRRAKLFDKVLLRDVKK